LRPQEWHRPAHRAATAINDAQGQKNALSRMIDRAHHATIAAAPDRHI